MFRDLCDLWVGYVEIFLQVNQGSFSVVSINMTFIISVNLCCRIRNIDFKMQVAYPDIMKKGEQPERSWAPLHLILMSVLWLSRFRRTQLLRWSDWMTEITCLESPTRQLIDNAWHKNVFVYPQLWLWAGFQFLVFFFSSETWFTRLKWIEGRVAGQEVSTESRLRRLAPYVPSGPWSSTSYSSHWACVVLKGI